MSKKNEYYNGSRPYGNMENELEEDDWEESNEYSWRYACEEGSYYGINPWDYETKEEYNEAIEEQRRQEEELQQQRDYENWFWFFGPGSEDY